MFIFPMYANGATPQWRVFGWIEPFSPRLAFGCESNDVALAEQAHKIVAIDHREATDLFPQHSLSGFLDIIIRADRDDLITHHFLDDHGFLKPAPGLSSSTEELIPLPIIIITSILTSTVTNF